MKVSSVSKTSFSPHPFPVRVYYEDTDCGGIVYHARYLHFFERARTEFLRDLGCQQRILAEEQKIGFVVSKIEVQYLLPAKFEDDLLVTSELITIKKASMIFRQNLIKDDQIFCKATVVIACIHMTQMKPIAIPKEIIELLTDTNKNKDGREHV